MWSKITNALRPRQTQESGHSESHSQSGEVLNKVFEQHPNLSVFVPPNDSSSTSNPSPPPSPSKSTKRAMLKRLSKLPQRDESENSKSSSSLRLSKKSRPELNFKTVGSNSPLAHAVNSLNENQQSSSDLSRRRSVDMLSSKRESPKPSRSSIDVLRRPSLDMLRNEGRSASPAPPALDEAQGPGTPGFDRMGSVRSILRDPKTPGTGQNVRFFSRDAYKVISPEISMDTEDQFFNQPPAPPPKDDPPSFLDRLNQASSDDTSIGFLQSSSKPNSKPPRPSISDLFSPLNGTSALPELSSQDEKSMSLSSPVPGAKSTDLFEISQSLPPFNPPGLDFDVHSPVFDHSIDLDPSFDKSGEAEAQSGGQRTSTPFRAKEFPKDAGASLESDNARNDNNSKPLLEAPAAADDMIFHGVEAPPRFPTPLHERTQSFTLGQTAFFSMEKQDSRDSSKLSAAYASSELKPPSSLASSANSSSSKPRTRAISDTVLQNMLRSTKSDHPPEADINDESSDHLVVYSAPPAAEPDPFSAHATTYYTPQVMIPTTPPSKQHIRKTSKEESLIYSLQTQLSLQNDLCQQYEIDLRARDEMVANLTQKLADVEKEDTKRRATLRNWKKKVQELERACRQLEDEVDSSRQMSFERSVMDEASGEALRMLHRQIAALERDKADQLKREEMLKEEVASLEANLKERTEDVDQLKEMLWNRDESERELQAGLREAREQMEQLSNVSIVVDEEEMRRLMSEKDQANDDQTRHRIMEVAWQQEREELVMKLEGLAVQNAACEEELEKTRQQMKARDDELAVLKSELEAQWSNTESMSEKIATLEKEKIAIEIEKEQLETTVAELEQRISNMEMDWNDGENKKDELESQVQEMWQTNEALQKDREQLEYDLQQTEERVEHLTHDLQHRDTRISELEGEIQFNKDLVTRTQESVRKRDEEIDEQANRIVKLGAESEDLREQLSAMTREYNRLLDEQSRVDRSVSHQEEDMKTRMDQIIKQKADVDVQLQGSREQVTALQDEVDRLRHQVQNLKQVSADADVELGRLKKQHAADKEDIFGLNMALDAKQQELELIKRHVGIRAGTPAKSISAAGAKTHRRDSSIFTATPLSRPPSVLSDSAGESISVPKHVERKGSSERPASSASVTRPSAALGRSNRVNTVSSKTSSGAMSPPPAKPRSSISSVSATPTPASTGGKPLGRSSSTRPSVVSPTGTPLPHRRVSSAVAVFEQQDQAAASAVRKPVSKIGRLTSPVPSVPERDEKENFGEDVPTPTVSSRRRIAVPAP